MNLKVFIITLVFILTSASAREWDAHDVGLKSQIEKIRAKEGKIAELIHEKNTTKDEAKLKNALSEITKEHKELVKLYEELENEKKHVRFEHPDRGIEIERKYHSYKVRSIEDLEAETGTDGRLTRLKSKVVRKYQGPPTEAKNQEASEKLKPKILEKKKEPGPERPKLSF